MGPIERMVRETLDTSLDQIAGRAEVPKKSATFYLAGVIALMEMAGADLRGRETQFTDEEAQDYINGAFAILGSYVSTSAENSDE